ncbi:MAG: hypothetical protein ATN31_03735 [Candidatus Epulonipiscioides saccharophilum]|nr:MAG: hypothetical protein ATN31_03735 [Epulopiscium sp. AS2M-Bin001]
MKFLYWLFILGCLVFCISFSNANKLSFDKLIPQWLKLNHSNPNPLPTTTEPFLGHSVDITSTVLPNTQVLQLAIDQNGNIVSTQELNSYSLIGYSKQDLEALYLNYHVIEFTPEKVVLVKNITVQPNSAIYYLAIVDNEVGIKINNTFQKLGLTSDNFSSYENTLLSHGVITVTEGEKAKLEKDPYYIERMLENLSE